MKNNVSLTRPLAAMAGLVALVAAVPAYAADVVMEEPPVPAAIPMEEPPLNTWSGPYAGVGLGYGFGETEDETFDNTIDTDGFLLNGFVGYNYQAGNVVVGPEADIGYNFSEGESAGTTTESGWEGSLRGRLGYVVTPEILLYVTAGGAAKQLEISAAGGSDSNTMLGWTAGAGADMMVTDNVFGRVEYRYTDFGSDTFTTGPVSGEVSDRDHRVTFGLGMKF
ncbi:MAG: Opacity protein antigen [Rhizobiaceae bacterium]|jgi:outer membrane immunogenic protein|nr:Opacity protein antigen [Rhizobiaceae bacterium]